MAQFIMLDALRVAPASSGSLEKEQPAAIGRNVLVRAGAQTKEVAELIVTLAEPGG